MTTYTKEELISLSKYELMQVARSLKIPSLGVEVRRREWVEAILKVSNEKATAPAREVKLENYQLKTVHIPLYKVCGGMGR